MNEVLVRPVTDEASTPPGAEAVGNAQRNIETLMAAGEIGRRLVPYYEAALELRPSLSDVSIIPIESSSDPYEIATCSAGYPQSSESGRAEIKISTGDNWGVYSNIMNAVPYSAMDAVQRLGITMRDLDESKLAAFIFGHELGHVVDYEDTGLDLEGLKERRQRDLDTLPIPGRPASVLRREINRDYSVWGKYLSQYKDRLEAHGVRGSADLHLALRRQEEAYRQLETEKGPDNFAVEVVQKVENESDSGFRPAELALSLGQTSEYRDTSAQPYRGHEGRYNVNNGIVCFVTSEGAVKVGAMTPRLKEHIEKQGLLPDESMGVALSNFEGDTEAIQKLRRVLANAIYAERGDDTSVDPKYLDGAKIDGEWLDMEGLPLWDKDEQMPEAKTSDGFPMGVPDYRFGRRQLRYDEEVMPQRSEEVGHFDVDGGLLAFVDGKGVKRVAPVTEERLSALEKAGYTHADVSNPLANGRKIMVPETAEKWERMINDSKNKKDSTI